MKIATDDHTHYCKELIKKSDYKRYLQCSFAPETIAYYALEAELRHIHDHVKEEMIGHIRYAWWAESIEALTYQKPPKHPVLQSLALSDISKEAMQRLITAYREAWPNLPTATPEFAINNPRWHDVGAIIARHENQPRWWLIVKLLCYSICCQSTLSSIDIAANEK